MIVWKPNNTSTKKDVKCKFNMWEIEISIKITYNILNIFHSTQYSNTYKRIIIKFPNLKRKQNSNDFLHYAHNIIKNLFLEKTIIDFKVQIQIQAYILKFGNHFKTIIVVRVLHVKKSYERWTNSLKFEYGFSRTISSKTIKNQ